MEAGEGAESLLEWIRSFDDLSRSCDSWADLCDGVILSELIQEINPGCLDDAPIELYPSEDDEKVNNLTAVASAIAEFYSETHDQVVPIDRLDFDAMIQESEEGIMHVRFLVEIMLASAIQCEEKEKYIRKIMNDLGHEAQAAIMSIVTNVVSADTLSPANTPMASARKAAASFDSAVADDDTDDDGDYAMSPQHNSQALLNLKMEKEYFESKNKELEEANATVKAELEDMRKLLSQTQRTNKDYLESRKVQDMERQKSFTSEMAKRENDLQGQLRQMAMQVKEKEDALMSATRMFQQRERQLKTEIKSLNDELDITRSSAAMSKRQQQQLQRYKDAVEDIPNLKKQRNELEKKNTEYLNKMLDMEAKMESIPALEQELQDRSDQVLAARAEVNKARLVVEEKDAELRRLHDQLMRTRREVASLEEDAAEALVDGSFEGESLAMERGLDLSILDSNRSSSPPNPALKETNARLERRVAQLQRDLTAAKAAKPVAPSPSADIAKLTKQLRTERAASIKKIKELRRALEKAKNAKASPTASAKASPSASEPSFERLKEHARKQKKDIKARNNKIVEFESLIVMLKEKLNAKQTDLNDRIMEQRKLEKYLSTALHESKKVVAEAKEDCQKQLKSFEAQRKEAEDEAKALRIKLEKVNGSRRKEQRLMMSAFYHMGTDLCNQFGKIAPDAAAHARTPTQSWLGRRRTRLRTPTHRR